MTWVRASVPTHRSWRSATTAACSPEDASATNPVESGSTGMTCRSS